MAWVYTETEKNGRRGKVLNTASVFEEKTFEQAAAISRGHITDGYVVMLPDAHFGIGACVGTAIKTAGGLYPSAVGTDPGCGMIAVQTSLKGSSFVDRRVRQTLRNMIIKDVPSGVGRFRDEIHEDYQTFLETMGLPGMVKDNYTATRMSLGDRARITDTASIQFGTLGAGNHFIEVCVDEQDSVWVVVHSGSRGVGNQISSHFMGVAKRLREADGTKLENNDLAFLKSGEVEFESYLNNLGWAQDYARASRELMMDLVILDIKALYGDFEELRRINCHHNYSSVWETEYGNPTKWVTRKGAIAADVGDWGVIPGSMRSDTYIVEGLGNAETYYTSAHGAGRLFARGRPPKKEKAGTGAWALFNVEDFKSQMEERDVVWQDRSAFYLLDESEGMYKSISRVIEDSASIVAPRYRLRQVVNAKGVD